MSRIDFAVIGRDISYSKSPEIFKAILDHQGHAGEMLIHSFEPDQLQSKLKNLIESGVSGISVTIPHKADIMKLLDEVSPEAEEISAVNSIGINDGRTKGYNTDIHGFCTTLERMHQRSFKKGVLILGSGGAARAVVSGLYRRFMTHDVTVAVRSIEHGKSFAGKMSEIFKDLKIDLIDLTSIRKIEKTLDLVVNCTPLGGPNQVNSEHPASYLQFEKYSSYVDLNYNPDNPLIARAKQHDIRAADGSIMLVAQAVKSFELWTGQAVPFEAIYEKVFPGRSDLGV